MLKKRLVIWRNSFLFYQIDVFEYWILFNQEFRCYIFKKVIFRLCVILSRKSISLLTNIEIKINSFPLFIIYIYIFPTIEEQKAAGNTQWVKSIRKNFGPISKMVEESGKIFGKTLSEQLDILLKK